MRTASLLERLRDYFDEVKLWSNQDFESPMPLYKFKALLLIAELYDYVIHYIDVHDDWLSNYFGEYSLKKCLENVSSIEDLKKTLYEIRYYLEVSEGWEEVNGTAIGIYSITTHIDNYELLYKYGVDGFWGNNEYERPAISRSLLWASNTPNNSKYQYGRVFSGAKEILVDKGKKHISPDPEDHPYNIASHQKELCHKIAYKADLSLFINNTLKLKDLVGSADSKELNDTSETNGFDFLNYIYEIHRNADDATADIIFVEMHKALECLRNVFMAAAEDIYYIRTGDFTNLEKLYDKQYIERLYTQLPLEKYYSAREDFVNSYNGQLEELLEEWRINKDYIERKLSIEEYFEFLNEQKNSVIEEMKAYPELWNLRKHCGGLDSLVTPENFARMFYRRTGVDKYFIELQWELEVIHCLIEETQTKLSGNIATSKLTDQQKAVNNFVEMILQLADTAYAKWHNQVIVPAVHKPGVKIIIKKDELTNYLNNEFKVNFDELSEICYPVTSTTKQAICKYVVKLKDEGYFGELSNKILAEILAPIIGLSSSTVTNYLSK